MTPPPTGTLRLPVTAETSTVLGLRVKPDGDIWRGLIWADDPRVDGAQGRVPHGQYLSVSFAPPGEGSMDYWHGVRYRVRYRYEIGQRIHVGNRHAYVLSVDAERGADGWEWVVGYGARAGKEETGK